MKEDNKFVTKCLRPDCTRDTYGGSRGLCVSHYSVLQAKVKKGLTTWEELEVNGLSKPRLTKEEYNEYRRHPQRKRKVEDAPLDS